MPKSDVIEPQVLNNTVDLAKEGEIEGFTPADEPLRRSSLAPTADEVAEARNELKL